MMELERAQRIASQVISRLSPYCQRIEVAGSVRRKKVTVKDIDLVAILSDPWNFLYEVRPMGIIDKKGDKLIYFTIPGGASINIYFATPETWATLFLIKTGSKESNIRLATLAKKRGWHLAASGDGLFNENGQRIAGDTEESIYGALDLPYQRPEKRG